MGMLAGRTALVTGGSRGIGKMIAAGFLAQGAAKVYITARKAGPCEATAKELTAKYGTPFYTRIDAAATPREKAILKDLNPDAVRAKELAGESITAKLTRAPGNDAPIGGLKVVTADGWFAARPSGTESIYKIYAESFRGQAHLDALVHEAQELVDTAIGGHT